MLIQSFKLTVEVAKALDCAGITLDASVIFRLGTIVNIAVEDRKVHPCPCLGQALTPKLNSHNYRCYV